MKRLNTLKLLTLTAAFFTTGLMLMSCDKGNDDVKPGENNATIFSVFSFIGDFAYLSATADVESGNLSVVENGLELNTYGVGAVQNGEHYYVWNSAESTIDQYEADSITFTKAASIAVPPLIPDERPRVMRTTDDGNLIINSWPDSELNVYYALISLPDFTVSKKGSVKLDSINSFQPSQTEFVISGDKAYLGTSYFDAEYTSYPDSLVTWVFDYPSFTNGEMVVSAGTPGNNGGYVGQSNIVDERGDVYQAPINSDHWYYSDEEAYIMKLTAGEYDASYNFNLSDALGKEIGLWSIFYAQDGIAYAKVIENDADYAWGPVRMTNTVTLVKIDLYNKTATEINLPKFKGFFMQHGVVNDGNFYLPIVYNEGDANVYGFDIDGGADDYTKGATLDGENILAGSVFKH